MPFEFAFLDWLYQFRNPVMNTISIFFDTPVLTARSGSRSPCCFSPPTAHATRVCGGVVRGCCTWRQGTSSSSRYSPAPAPAISTLPSPCWWHVRMGIPSPPGTPPPGWRLPTRSGCKTESWARPRWCWQPLSPFPGCTSMCTSPPMSLRRGAGHRTDRRRGCRCGAQALLAGGKAGRRPACGQSAGAGVLGPGTEPEGTAPGRIILSGTIWNIRRLRSGYFQRKNYFK